MKMGFKRAVKPIQGLIGQHIFVTLADVLAVMVTRGWIGCVAVDQSGEWMVYGGSDAPVVFHLGSMNKILSLPVPDGVVSQGAIFAKDNIITVGSEPTVRHWTVNGLPVAAVPGGHNHAFSVAFNDSSVHYEVLAVSGDSSDVNIFTNFGYKAFSLSVC
eukprot:Em0696g1a